MDHWSSTPVRCRWPFASPPTARPASRAPTCEWSTPPVPAQISWPSTMERRQPRRDQRGVVAVARLGPSRRDHHRAPARARPRLTVRTQQDNGRPAGAGRLDQLIARTNNGPVVLSGAARRIEMHTVDGDVSTRDPISVTEPFSAETDNGDIEVDLTDAAPRAVEATSRNGDVIVALPSRGPTWCTQSGQSTRVRVPKPTTPRPPPPT